MTKKLLFRSDTLRCIIDCCPKIKGALIEHNDCLNCEYSTRLLQNKHGYEDGKTPYKFTVVCNYHKTFEEWR